MKVGRDRRMPLSACTNCGKLLDGATCVGNEGKPKRGDFSVCLTCGHLMVFDRRRRLRDPTDEEMVEIAGDKRLIAIQKARQQTGETDGEGKDQQRQ